MTAITYIEHNGTEHTVEVSEGMSLMDGASLNMVPGLDGLCGGICSCATCHCYIEKPWEDQLPAPAAGELRMLEKAKYLQGNSRLGCQVTVTAEMDGMRVHLPLEQGSVDG